MGKATALSISHSGTWPCEKGFFLPAMGLLRGLCYKPASQKSSKHMKTYENINKIRDSEIKFKIYNHPWTSLDYTASSKKSTDLLVDVASFHWFGALDIRHNEVNAGTGKK